MVRSASLDRVIKKPAKSYSMLVFISLLLPFYCFAEIIFQLDNGRQIVGRLSNEHIESSHLSTRAKDPGALASIAHPGGDSPEQVVAKTRPILRVGPERELQLPSDAAKIARDGTVIEIDSGVYLNDYARWPQNNLTIRGVGSGMAHLKSSGLIPNDKAIWITQGNNIQIENVEFSGAAVENTNGAGIRHEGGDLTLHNTFFHDNEFSILSGDLPQAVIEITSSRFWFQKRPTRHSHGLYIGQARRLVLKGSHVKGTDQGHQVKSRALENYILYNRIEEVDRWSSSRLVDLSNCGFSIIMGNDLYQASMTENNNIIGYGPEGCSGRTERQMKLFVINNTLVNEAAQGTLVRNFAEGDVTVANNLVFGPGDFLAGAGSEVSNFREDLRDRPGKSWSAPAKSGAVNGAVEQPPVDGISLTPASEFLPPAGYRDRPVSGKLDAGSRESTPL